MKIRPFIIVAALILIVILYTEIELKNMEKENEI